MLECDGPWQVEKPGGDSRNRELTDKKTVRSTSHLASRTTILAQITNDSIKSKFKAFPAAMAVRRACGLRGSIMCRTQDRTIVAMP